MVLCENNLVKALLHNVFENDSLLGCLNIGDKN